jgi:hypothetical protein
MPSLHGAEMACMIRQTLLLTLFVLWLGVSAGLAQNAPSQTATSQIIPAPTGPAQAAVAQTTTPQTTPPAPATPETVSVGSIGLRTGFDSNPTDILGAHSSLFATQTVNYDYLRGSLQDGIALSLKAIDTIYDPNVAAPSTAVIAAATVAMRLAPNLNLRSTLTTTVDDNWSRRFHSVQWRNRVEYDTSEFRIFANLDTGISALNERNIFTDGGFLPLDENFTTTTIMPGAAYKFGTGEIGASVAVSRVSYLALDILGLNRSHDILQPNAFFTARVSGIDLEGSLSPYLANYDTTDFDNVRALLYTAKIRYPTGPWTFGVASSRTMLDTTLPFASLDEASAHEASVSYKIDDKDAVSLFTRYRRDDYLGTPLWSTTFLTGVDFARDLGDGLTGTAAASIRQVRRPDEVQPWALNLQVGVQKRLDFGGTPTPAPDKATAVKSAAVQ